MVAREKISLFVYLCTQKTFLNILLIMLAQFSIVFGGPVTPCASPPPRPSIFSDYSFWVHHLFNRDDWHLLAQPHDSQFIIVYNRPKVRGDTCPTPTSTSQLSPKYLELVREMEKRDGQRDDGRRQDGQNGQNARQPRRLARQQTQIQIWDRCYDYLNIFAEKFGEKIGVFA
jgi:hypothetical protein